MSLDKRLIQLTRAFLHHSIQTKTLIPALNALFFPDLTHPDHHFFVHFWQYLRKIHFNHTPPVFHCSVVSLAECLHDFPLDTIQDFFQEIVNKQSELIPGVALHITLGILLYAKDQQAEARFALEPILRVTLTDILQNPCIKKTVYDHLEIIAELFPDRQVLDITPESLASLDQVLTHLRTSHTRQLLSAMQTLLAVISSLELNSAPQLFTNTARAYLQAHPKTLNAIIADGLSKHFHIGEKLRCASALWHIAFLDQWIHEHTSAPYELKKLLVWLEDDVRNNLIHFCTTNKTFHAYLNTLLAEDLSFFLREPLYPLAQVHKQISLADIKGSALLQVTGALLGIQQSDHHIITQLLESIDQERTSFFLTYRQEINQLADILLHYYKLDNNFNHHFSEIHNDLMRIFESPYARRTAYLILLQRKLNLKTMRDFFAVTELMQRRFDLERYDCSLSDLSWALYNISTNNCENILSEVLSSNMEGMEDIVRSFFRTFVTYFGEVLHVIEEPHRLAIGQWLHTHLLLLGTDFMAETRLKEVEEGRLLLDNKDLLVISLSSRQKTISRFADKPEFNFFSNLWFGSTQDDRAPQNELATYQDWQMRIFLESLEIATSKLRTIGYIPVLYHPHYGYGFVYYNLRYLVIFYDESVPDTITSRYRSALYGNFDIIIIDKTSAMDLHETKRYLEQSLKATFISNCIIEFSPAKAISEIDGLKDSTDRVYIDRETIIELFGRNTRRFLLI